MLVRHLFVISLSVVCFGACHLPQPDARLDSLNENQSELDAQILALLEQADNNVAFIFFTDPHLLGTRFDFSESAKAEFVSSFNDMKVLYERLPISFCLCGGDWLNSGDTQAQAKEKLLFADIQMKSMFPRYFKMMGNHDTNYQGIVSSTDSSRGDLPDGFVSNVYFSEVGAPYYLFHSKDTAFYILDSGIDWVVRMDDNKWAQIKWLAGRLEEEKMKHVVLGVHMLYKSGKIIPMSEELVALCDSYNHKGIYVANGDKYDFSKASGTIHSIFTGHMHRDSISFVGANKDIPVIQTCNYTKENSHVYDICILNYGSGYLELIRIGGGINRRAKMVSERRFDI